MDKTNIKSVRVNQGLFIETFFYFESDGLGYWGDSNVKIDLTTFDDTARFVVELAADPEKHGQFAIIANQLTIPEIADIYNKVRGTNIKARNLGSLEDIQKIIDSKKDELVPYTYLQIKKYLHSGIINFKKNNNNLLKNSKITSFEQFLRENPTFELK